MEAGFSQIRSHITIKHSYSTVLTSVHLEITLGVNVGEQELITSIPEDVWTSKSSLRSRDPTWWYHMWLDLRKAGFHAHNGRPRFPLLIHSPIHRLTFHASLSAKNLPVCFCWGLFCRRSDVLVCAVGHHSAMAGQNRGSVGWEWPHDSTVILAIGLATFCGIFCSTGPYLGPPTSL